MATILDRSPERLAAETAWRRMAVQVFVRADDEGNPTHLRFQFENGDHHVASVRHESDELRALAERLLRTTPPRGHCSRWFG
jgi:hypothetical protein